MKRKLVTYPVLFQCPLFRGLGSDNKNRESYLAYISEGMGKQQNWDMAMKYQMKNGSLLNSPSATAAALSHLQNADCLLYLRSLLDKFGNAGSNLPLIFLQDAFCLNFIISRTCNGWGFFFWSFQFQQCTLLIYMLVYVWSTILNSWELIVILG